MRIEFTFISEGKSDRALIPHLQTLCLRAGASEVLGDTADRSLYPQKIKADLSSKIKAALDLSGKVDLIFIHRDADGAGRDARLQEIEVALRALRAPPLHVAIIPAREMEAWLLADEPAIRRIAGDPASAHDLGLPPLKLIEARAKPKECLWEALTRCTPAQGRRLKEFKEPANLSRLRARLLESLDIDGPVKQLHSWRALICDIERAVAQLAAAASPSPAPAGSPKP